MDSTSKHDKVASGVHAKVLELAQLKAKLADLEEQGRVAFAKASAA